MSKKRDPIVAILNYFLNVELRLAEQGLELAKEIVRGRRQPMRAAAVKKKPASKDNAADAAEAAAPVS